METSSVSESNCMHDKGYHYLSRNLINLIYQSVEDVTG